MRTLAILNRIASLIAAIALLLVSNGLARANSKHFQQLWMSHRFYFGPIFGYGNTDWDMMVMQCDSGDFYCSKDTVGVSAPLGTTGSSGAVWGATAGYELKPSWGIEASYLRFPTTQVQLNAPWNFYMEHDYNTTQFSSSTWALFAVAKFMTEIGNSGLRGFANAGIDFTARNDVLSETIHVNPTFGVGINYVFPSNFMLEGAFQYMTGYGDANEVPARDYIPFLYSLTLKLLYRL